ncbi:TetR family transcriptional regulator [Mycobacterium sp. CVI_P3]|uniref:TetR family transcriptional regulator n=1 Tax=Mycobacterium pinniadriaticum TaxID=2994102 RepID=A0ABT3S817_9MYCO|nr:TetR/AcrR family transcriptional regulator [Mycobacterium pinniadriaticum]MCX2929214.1 TetR family transcriptional regulator [Mycobacterium pinniadriaticum]MCX2935639.1 TetR family transcriptional regulator [Mycobacterium pinniadriaticum]
MDRGARSREELLDAAERLIAEHGFEVPLREIAVAAGQRNNSAVNYYFRSRQDLIDAVVARRLVPMEVERQAMLDCMSDEQMADAHAVLRILVEPFFHSEGTHYARFLEVVRIRLNKEPQSPAESAWPRILDALARLVPLQERRAREGRVGAVATTMFALLADHERRVESGDGPRGQERSASGDVSNADSLEEIVTMLAAMLTAAPVTATATR